MICCYVEPTPHETENICPGQNSSGRQQVPEGFPPEALPRRGREEGRGGGDLDGEGSYLWAWAGWTPFLLRVSPRDWNEIPGETIYTFKSTIKILSVQVLALIV